MCRTKKFSIYETSANAELARPRNIANLTVMKAVSHCISPPQAGRVADPHRPYPCEERLFCLICIIREGVFAIREHGDIGSAIDAK